MDSSAVRPAWSRRAFLGASAVGAALLAISALVFANARGAVTVAEQAVALSGLQTAETEARLAQAQLSQALLLAVDRQAGLASEETVDRAIDMARHRLAMLDTLIAESGAPAASAHVYTEGALELLAMLEAGSVGEASSEAPRVQGLYDDALGELVTARRLASERISSVGSLAGLVADLSALMVALVVPAAMIGLYRYISRRQVRSATLEAQLAAERHLNKTKNEFIANVSHELRTPLTGISGLAQLLEDSMLEDPETALELVNLIISEAGELERMVEDLLTAARDTAGVLDYHIEVVEPREELLAVLRPMERHVGPIPLDCPTVKILADRVRFRQVLRNLLANARHHGGPGVWVSCEVVGNRFECSVIDNGAGVPPDLEPRLFDRYVHRGEQPLVVGSVGLGLSIARVLTEGMNGTISYQRVDGETRFIVKMPLAQVDLEALRDASEIGLAGAPHA